jgi:hypothetical protein
MTAAEQFGNIPAKLGGALRQRATEKPTTVVQEHAPTIVRNTRWPWPQAEDGNASGPLVQRAVRMATHTLRVAGGSLRGAI